METPRGLVVLAPFAFAMLLAACNDNSPAAADFAPGSASPAEPAASGDAVPVEVAREERSKPLSPSSDCNLERLDGERFSGDPVRVASSRTIELTGWLADTATRSVPGSFELRMIGVESNRAWEVVGHAGQARSDVQAILGGDAGYANAGYSVTVDPGSLPRDSYRMYLVYAGQDGLKSCDNGRSIVVGD